VVKHLELNVIRDEFGRVLRTETHEWEEGPDLTSKHLQTAQIERTSGGAHGEVSELKARIAELRVDREREIAAARDAGYKQGRYEAVTIATEQHEALMRLEKEEGR